MGTGEGEGVGVEREREFGGTVSYSLSELRLLSRLK